MHKEYILLCTIILILFLLQRNANFKECMGTGPAMFIEEGYGESGQYTDNINLEPVYRKINIPTIYNRL